METSFAHLEKKVVEAVDLIKGLRAENSRLKQGEEKLQARCDELEQANRRLQEELAEARSAAAQAGQYAEKSRIIEEKVGGLLEKLEALG
ncbi:MAG: cell division protein ZapB [Candidatus Krumholzibacteriia bacterium]